MRERRRVVRQVFPQSAISRHLAASAQHKQRWCWPQRSPPYLSVSRHRAPASPSLLPPTRKFRRFCSSMIQSCTGREGCCHHHVRQRHRLCTHGVGALMRSWTNQTLMRLPRARFSTTGKVASIRCGRALRQMSTIAHSLRRCGRTHHSVARRLMPCSPACVTTRPQACVTRAFGRSYSPTATA